MSTPEKLTIKPDSASGFPEFKVQFNPNTYSIGKTVSWPRVTTEDQGTDRRRNAPATDFGGGQSRSLSLELFFDTTEETADANKDVRNLTNQIVRLTRIVPKLGRSPVCKVSWGAAPPDDSDLPFTGVITQLTQHFNLFLPDGRPVRANLNVTFTEWLDPELDEKKTDPELTTRLVRRGDTLSLIAGEVYGDPTLWRVIAAYNQLDDPRHIPVGMRLSIPDIRSGQQ
jgi:nucleoid-associated protein YgaU